MPDIQQQRLLDRLRGAAGRPVTFEEMRAEGIAFPAALVSELELAGYVLDRVYDHGRLVGVRLLEREEPEPHSRGRRRRLGWRHR